MLSERISATVCVMPTSKIIGMIVPATILAALPFSWDVATMQICARKGKSQFERRKKESKPFEITLLNCFAVPSAANRVPSCTSSITRNSCVQSLCKSGSSHSLLWSSNCVSSAGSSTSILLSADEQLGPALFTLNRS